MKYIIVLWHPNTLYYFDYSIKLKCKLVMKYLTQNYENLMFRCLFRNISI